MIWESLIFWQWVLGIEFALIGLFLWHRGLFFDKSIKKKGINKRAQGGQEIDNPVRPMGIPRNNSPKSKNNENTKTNPKRRILS